MKIDPNAHHIIETLEAAGASAWCVGGCIRDLLLGRTPDDWDIATSARPEEVKALFSRTVDTGIQHGTVTVLVSGSACEVTTYRVEGAYEDGRHPSAVDFVADVSGDLSRRDFTINALAYHPDRGLLDLFGGRADLERRVVRCVGEPDRRFSEDALRMMRAVRFAATLDFTLDGETQAAIARHAAEIGRVSAERVRDELAKLLLSGHPDRGLRLMEETGLLACVLPEVQRCVGVAQHIKYHKYDVFRHTCAVVANVPPVLSLRCAALLHDVGKPSCRTTDENGVDHFNGHAAVSASLAAEAVTRLKLDRATADAVVRLVRHHDREIRPDRRAVKRALMRVGEDLYLPLLALKRGDCLGQNLTYTAERLPYYDELERIYGEIKAEDEAFSLRSLAVNGHDLMACGLAGREIGETLRALLDYVVDHPEENERERLLARVRASRAK